MDLLNAYARCVRIVRPQGENLYEVDAERFTSPASTTLYQALQTAKASMPEKSTVDQALLAIQSTVPAINAFFEEVLVMDEDQAVRENRLGLVQQVAALPAGIVDLSKLEGF